MQSRMLAHRPIQVAKLTLRIRPRSLFTASNTVESGKAIGLTEMTLSPAASAAPSSQDRTHLADTPRQLLPLLQAQKPHYITAHIHAKPYLLTAGDTLRLPFLMPGVRPGDVLRLNRATLLGSRDFTLSAPPAVKGTRERPGTVTRYLDDRLFVCRATVLGVEGEPMRVLEKTKRRRRHVKRVKSKHRYTLLRISELTVKTPEEVELGK